MDRVGRVTLVAVILFARFASAGLPACVGDCDGDGAIGIQELIRGVNIALDRAPLGNCPSFDVNGDGRVGISELIAGVRAALEGCVPPTAGPSPTPLAGLIEGESFTLAAGARVDVTGDLMIRVTGAVDIAADLTASLAAGQTIDIEAGDDVTIAATVGAGNGGAPSSAALSGSATASAGGSVVIRSLNGDITVAAGARLVAGDGTAGGRGGDVALSAPNGTIAAADTAGVIHIGNGGDGIGLIAGEPGDREDLPNRGGASGLLVFDAPAITAPALLAVTLAADFTPRGGDLTFPSGAQVSVATSRTAISGGRGGDAGTFDAGDANGGPGPFSALIRRGAPGGDGYFDGGRGADIALIGRDGPSPGSDGQTVIASGGHGGGCPMQYDAVFCLPGAGGRADGIAGNGADGAPSEPGGDGGLGTAIGGNSANRPDDLAASSVFGAGGEAIGSGGVGGDGGDGCPPGAVEAFGGAGGNGGFGDALGGNSHQKVPDELRGRSVATGGDGGDGGDGVIVGDLGGRGGPGSFLREENVLRMSSLLVDGIDGLDGDACPPPTAPPATPQVTATRTHTHIASPSHTRTPTPTTTPTRTPTDTPTQTAPTTPTDTPTPTNLSGV